MDIDQVKIKIKTCIDLNDLNKLRIEILGKTGLLAEEFKKLASIPNEQKKEFGQKINIVKEELENLIFSKKVELEEIEMENKLSQEYQDLSLTGRKSKLGKIHPITQTENELINIFAHLGFTIREGNSIVSDWYNFTALNFSENHPARQMHDSFYLPNRGEEEMVLRTHTSPVQVKTMLNEEAPYRFISPGRTYRSDYDATHTPMFHQIEGFAVERSITMSHMKFVIIEFVKSFFEGQDIDIRFRPSFFPFTTHSAEVDIMIKDSKNPKWLEILGCGMVHPEVLKNGKIDPELYQGFAFGLGIERMAMLKYGINDLRQFYESDIRWLSHYSFSHFDIPSLLGGLTR